MLFCKMMRDMGRHKAQFISIFLMSFLAVFLYTGIGGEWMGLKKNSESYYNKTNFASAFIYGDNFTQKDEKAAEGVAGVTNAERSLVIDTIGKVKNNPKVTLHFVTKNQISKAYLVSGEAFSPDKDGIWLDARFAKARCLAVGDSFTVTYKGLTIKKTIKGTIYSPEYIYEQNDGSMAPDFAANGYAYLSYKQFPVKSALVYNRMMLESTAAPEKIESKIDKALNGKDSVYLTKANHPSYNMFQQEIDQHKSMGSIFPVAFVLIALLTILTTMTRIVTGQRTQIGTLKALGFKKRKIVFHYLGYGFFVSLFGSALGVASGPAALPRLFYPTMSGFYTLPEWSPAYDVSFYLMAALMVALCTLTTYLACRKVLRDSPASMLLPKSPKNIRHGILEKTRLWQKLGFNMQWNLRDVFRNKTRSIMAVVGVLGCTALIICAFGLYDDMNGMKSWQYGDLDHFASKLSVKDTASESQIENAKNKTDGLEMMEGTVEIKANGLKKSGALTVADKTNLLCYTDSERNFMVLPENGLSISYKMAQQLGVKLGDTIRFHLYGSDKWVNTKIDAIYRDPSAQGIALSVSHFKKLGFTFKATSIISGQNVTGKFPGISAVTQKKSLLKAWDDMTKSAILMVYILIAAAALLAVVVLYNLGVLSFTEMSRELATLKVLGFKSARIRGLLLTQNILLSTVGFIIGIPAGKALIDVMTSQMGDSYDMITHIQPANLAMSFVITFLLSLLVNLMFSGKIKKIDMVGSLKGAE